MLNMLRRERGGGGYVAKTTTLMRDGWMGWEKMRVEELKGVYNGEGGSLHKFEAR